jgi:CRISPR type III-A-associated RAMP protein Csm4
MNPALVIKLRPMGPWRIGPDSGARNQVDAIYHSDSLYAAVTSAMVRIGLLDDWLSATAANGMPAVSFSSCFPFVDEIGFVVPPRTVWPPSATALLAARVRWKSARFVPLGIIPGLLSGQVLDETQWSIDGPSACLVPAGRNGPFRRGLRFNAAVDRLSGAAERHSVACIEFQPGGGLWAVASFADQAARDRWIDPLKTAFRFLADSGFGGERSRGWGRAETPDFTEGMLPEMILPLKREPGAGVREQEKQKSEQQESEQGPGFGNQGPENPPEGAVPPEAIPEPNPPAPDPPLPAPIVGPQAHWLLSLFVPGPHDSIDWGHGSYGLVTRAGRVESAAGSGELKKQIQMVVEGSVLHAASGLRGLAADVAPDGFAHPVYRAGFAVSVPVPGVS